MTKEKPPAPPKLTKPVSVGGLPLIKVAVRQNADGSTYVEDPQKIQEEALASPEKTDELYQRIGVVSVDNPPVDDVVDDVVEDGTSVPEEEQKSLAVGPGVVDPATTALQISRDGNKVSYKVAERRKKVMALLQVGLTFDEMLKELNGLAGEESAPISEAILAKDISEVQRAYRTRPRIFDAKSEIGQALFQYDFLYEQALGQFYAAPEGSSQRGKFLDLARQTLDAKQKYLQTVGLVEKVAEKKIIEHQEKVMKQINGTQKKFLEDQLVEMALKYTSRGAVDGSAIPQVTQRVIDADYEEVGEDNSDIDNSDEIPDTLN